MRILSYVRKCPSKQRCSYSVHLIFFRICSNADKVNLLLWCCRWLKFSEKECTTLLLIGQGCVSMFSIYQYSNKITAFLASLEHLFVTWWIIIIITTVIIKLGDCIEYLWCNYTLQIKCFHESRRKA